MMVVGQVGLSTLKKIDEKSHEKAYKKCVKNSAKYNIQEDCFIFAIDDKIVWNLDGPAKPTKPEELESAESKAEKAKQAQLDKDQEDFLKINLILMMIIKFIFYMY